MTTLCCKEGEGAVVCSSGRVAAVDMARGLDALLDEELAVLGPGGAGRISNDKRAEPLVVVLLLRLLSELNGAAVGVCPAEFGILAARGLEIGDVRGRDGELIISRELGDDGGLFLFR